MSLRELHERMGHISITTMRDVVCKGMIEGIKVIVEDPNFQCRSCILAKAKRESIPGEREGKRALDFWDEIHSDLWGHAQVKTLGGRIYFISFTDDWSRWTTIYLMRTKTEAFSSYRSFAAWVKTQLDTKSSASIQIEAANT